MVLDGQSAPKLRSACNSCRQLKVRCSGGNPCQNCANSDSSCDYGVSNRLGRPRGAKNRQPSKGHALAPAPLTSGPRDGQTSSTPDTVIWLSPQPDKSALTPDPWPLVTVADPVNQEQPRLQQQLHGHYTLKFPEGPTPPEMAEHMSFMYSADQDLLGPDDNEAPVLSWAPSPQDMPSFFGTGNQMLYDEAHARAQNGWPLALEPPTPPVSADDVLGLATAFGNFVDPTVKDMDSAPPSEAGAAAGGISECVCLQRHMDLLCSLKRPQLHRPSAAATLLSKGGTGGLPVDCVLQNVQEAWEACRAVTECHDALDNHDHEVILLLVMCLRTVVSQIQQLPWQMSGKGSPGLVHAELRDDEMRSRESSSPLENRAASTTGSGGVPILVGEFEVCGDDKDLLLGSLRTIGLRKLAAGLTMLRQLVVRKKAEPKTQQARTSGAESRRHQTLMMDSMQDAGDLNNVERMMDGLMHSINLIMNSRGVDDRYLGL